METFSALLVLCAGNSPVTGEFPAHRPVTRSFDIFFDLCLNKRLSKQSWGWWFETPSRSLWHESNGEFIDQGVGTMSTICLTHKQMSTQLEVIEAEWRIYASVNLATSACFLLIESLGINFSEILIDIHIFLQENAFENVVWETEVFLSRTQWVNNVISSGDTSKL